MTSDRATSTTARRNHPAFVSVAAVLAWICVGCGGGLKGSYTPVGLSFTGMFISNVTFNSADKVEVTAMGMTKEGSYVVDGKKVKITISGDTTVMTIDDQGCLDGGGLIGRLCKK